MGSDEVKRWCRSHIQRILLFDVKQVNANKLCITLLGASNIEYQITLKRDCENREITYKCSCPDFMYRNIVCKHLYWLSHKEMRNLHPDEWDDSIYQLLLFRYSCMFQEKGRNDTCGICLEEIDYDTEHVICCTTGCQNAIHGICWNRFMSKTNNDLCIYCRDWAITYDLSDL